MPKQKLTKSVVERLEPRCAELIVWDESLPGFGLRVKPNGNRSYVIQYRNRNTGASKRMTVGPHGPTLTFDQAKKQARIILADVLRGNDPAGKRRAERSGPTVADLARDYLERHAIPNKRPRSVRADCALIDQIIDPKLGRKKVVAVERRDIEAIHIGMTKRPYQANRLLALTSKMFNLAIAWKWRSASYSTRLDKALR